MTNQPLDYAALRATATSAQLHIPDWYEYADWELQSLPGIVSEYLTAFDPPTVLALLDESERLRTAMREALAFMWSYPDKAQGILQRALGEGEKHE